jgi:4-hydroxy-4-methyl-2-oxoglutarate aldolase
MIEDLCNRLAQGYSGAVYDVMREMGLPDSILPYYIKPLNYKEKIIAPVFTVVGERVDVSVEESMLKWTEFLSCCPADSVVVCQPNDHELSHMGELSAETLKLRGIKGYIVDGGCRDTEFIEQIGFPVWCQYRTPVDICGRWIPTDTGIPIKIGNVVINNGDYLLADIDGIAILPMAHVEEIVSRVEEVISAENKVRTEILGGGDPKEAYLKYGKF